MFIWASLARHAKRAGLTRVLCVFFVVQVLLALPVGISIMRDPPYVFYPRVHGGPDFAMFPQGWEAHIDVAENENGFIEYIEIKEDFFAEFTAAIEGEDDRTYAVLATADLGAFDGAGHRGADYLLGITPEYLLYRDAHSALIVPVDWVSAWAVRDADLHEMFNHLALYNQYFGSIVAPFFLLVFAILIISQAAIIFAAVWLFGYWVKLTGNMTMKERFAVCTFASVPAGVLAFGVGLFVPMVHLALFPFMMIYFSYKALKAYWNA